MDPKTIRKHLAEADKHPDQADFAIDCALNQLRLCADQKEKDSSPYSLRKLTRGLPNRGELKDRIQERFGRFHG